MRYRHLFILCLLLLILLGPELISYAQWDQPTTQATTTQNAEASDDMQKMTFWQAIVIGVVEGVTEYLPVSSTGHIILAQHLTGVPLSSESERQAANAYAVVIQIGAILAVLGIYWQRIWRMLRGLTGKDPEGLKLFTHVCVAFFPAAVIGFILDDFIEAKLMNIWFTVIAWGIGGIAIIVVEMWRLKKAKSKSIDSVENENEEKAQEGETDTENAVGLKEKVTGLVLELMTWRMALIIGLLQCVAMWPGTSRSLMTILGGVLVGLRVKDAVEFSFLLGLVTLTAATGYKMIDAGPLMLETYGIWEMLAGIVAAGVSAFVAVKWMVAFLNKHSLMIFGWYRVGLAIVVGIMLISGWLVVSV